MKFPWIRALILVAAAAAQLTMQPVAAVATTVDGTAVVSGYDNGPVSITGGGVYSEVAALPLEAGVWYVRATA